MQIRQATQSTTGPLLLGFLRPSIVLPLDFEQRYTPQEQRLILAHELLHLHRGDLIANALITALQVLFWFNPLIHWAAQRVRLDQELACDAAVLAQAAASAPHQAYASAILETILIDQHSPVACTWQSLHPIYERIMQFNLPAPNRASRISMQSLLADKVSTMQLPVKPFYLSVATWTREMREQGVVHEYSFASLFHNANGSHCTAKMECPT